VSSFCLAQDAAEQPAPTTSVAENAPVTVADSATPETETAADNAEATHAGPGIALPDTAEVRHAFIYAFEHKFLPIVWRNHAAEISEGFASEGNARIQSLFGIVEDVYSLSFPDDKSQLDVEPLAFSMGVKGWLVTFPEPRQTLDANYAALLFDGGLLRYIVGEYDDTMGQVNWFLCEWTDVDDGSPMQSHLNYGIQPIGTKPEFIDMVNNLLLTEQAHLITSDKEPAPENDAPQAADPEAPTSPTVQGSDDRK